MGQIKIAIPYKGKKLENYVNAIEHIGEQAFSVDYDFNIDDYSGLLLPGGYDVCPKSYGDEIDGVGKMDPELDDLQFSVLDRFVKSGKPVFGICRGHQLINVYFGGTLIQDLSTESKALHTPVDWGIDKVHQTRTGADSWLADVYGKTDIITNSAHHQAICKLGEGLVPVQWGEDGLIEACYHKDLPIISVQWHPERMCFEKLRQDTDCGQKVIEYFLKMCRAYEA